MTPDYRQGRADGLREAVDAVREMIEDVDRRLARGSKSITTRNARRTRLQAYRNAETRITTRLKRRLHGEQP